MADSIFNQKRNISLLIHIFSLFLKYFVGIYGFSGKLKLTQGKMIDLNTEIMRYKDI